MDFKFSRSKVILEALALIILLVIFLIPLLTKPIENILFWIIIIVAYFLLLAYWVCGVINSKDIQIDSKGIYSKKWKINFNDLTQVNLFYIKSQKGVFNKESIPYKIKFLGNSKVTLNLRYYYLEQRKKIMELTLSNIPKTAKVEKKTSPLLLGGGA
jgi:hypothetical protein